MQLALLPEPSGSTTPNAKAATMEPHRTWMIQLGGSEFKLMRLQDKPASKRGDTPEAIVTHLREQLADSVAFSFDVENFIVVLLNTRRNVIGWQVISNGTLDTLLVHPREVFKAAIVANAAAIILAHNLCAAAHKLCYVERGFM